MMPIGLEIECRDTLSKFYKDFELESTVDVLKELLPRRG